MTQEQQEAVEAFAQVRIYYPGKAAKFQEAMTLKLDTEPDYELSPRQWAFICDLLHTYRRQVPSHIHEKHCTDETCIRQRRNEALKRLQLRFSF